MKLLAAVLMLLALLAGPAAAADSGVDPIELERTFSAARVYLPLEASPGVRRADVAALAAGSWSGAGQPRAVVLFAHGCDGLGRIADAIGWFLAKAGYLVVAPDGFARAEKPVSCDPARHRGSLHRAVLGWRQAELRHAAERLRGLDALAGLPLVLMGHSEGAITVATLGGVPVAARIVEGWTCHAGWPEYRGLAAPAGQPVLSLLGADDPWFTLPVLQGDCGQMMRPGPLARSIVYHAPHPLHDQHWLSFDPAVQREILAFLDAALSSTEISK